MRYLVDAEWSCFSTQSITAAQHGLQATRVPLRFTRAADAYVGRLSLNRKVLLMSDFQYFLKWLSENSCLSMRAAEITGREPAHDILEDR